MTSYAVTLRAVLELDADDADDAARRAVAMVEPHAVQLVIGTVIADPPQPRQAPQMRYRPPARDAVGYYDPARYDRRLRAEAARLQAVPAKEPV